jgi:hypothetical protein
MAILRQDFPIDKDNDIVFWLKEENGVLISLIDFNLKCQKLNTKNICLMIEKRIF